MVTGGEEEKVVAIARNNVHEGAKKSHKHSYNSFSGDAITIGKEPGKILLMGVRNKYCLSVLKENTQYNNLPNTTALKTGLHHRKRYYC